MKALAVALPKKTVLGDTAAKRLFDVPIRHISVTVLCVLVSTTVAEIMYDLLDLKRVSAVFLAAVLVSAASFGLKPGLLAATLAFASYNLLTVEPRYSLRIDTPEEWLNLLIFFAVAMLTGGLAGRVKEEAVRARMQTKTVSALFAASRNLSSMASEDEVRSGIAALVADAVGGEAEVIWGGVTWRKTTAGLLDGRLSTWTTVELASSVQHLGVVRWRTVEQAPTRPELTDFVTLIAELGAVALARARTSAKLARSDLQQPIGPAVSR